MAPNEENKQQVFTSDDSVLLKMHRIYGKDESLRYLFDSISSQAKEIKELKFRVGELISENSELMHHINKTWGHKSKKNILQANKDSSEMPPLPKDVKKEWKKDQYIESLKKNLAAWDQKNLQHKEKEKQLKDDVLIWKNKYFDELAKNTKSE